jgi:predicted dehydrogenase
MGSDRQVFRTAIIGHTGRGDYGHALDTACLGVPEIRIVAIADPDPVGRAAALARCGVDRGYDDYQEMLERERPDLAIVAPRWVDQHAAMLLAAIQVGAHVYCEKPFVRTLAEADQIIAAADRAGIKIAVAHIGRAFPAMARIRDAVRGGAVGRLRLIRAFGKCDRRGGGQDLLVLGTHTLDLMRYFAGDVAWVQAHMTQGGHDITAADVREGEEGIGLVAGDAVVSYFAFRNGGAGEFESFVAEDASRESFVSVALQGTTGTIGIRSLGDRQLYHHRRSAWLPGALDRWTPLELPGLTVESPANPAESYPWAHRQLLSDLLGAIAEDREPSSSGRDARAALEMIAGTYESQLQGRRVEFPLANRESPLGLRQAPSDG